MDFLYVTSDEEGFKKQNSLGICWGFGIWGFF